MAVTQTPRLGLQSWSAGTDPHPNREEWDAQQHLLDQLVAVDVQVATWADRPSGAARGTYLWVEADRALWRATGTGWELITRIGGGGAGVPVVIGGSGVEGVSSNAARADHSHSIPLVTSSQNGAMRSADKEKLDRSSAAVVGSSLMERNASGDSAVRRLSLSDAPVAASDATRKSYVDAGDAAARAHADSAVAAIPEATGTKAGLMPASDKALLDTNTANNTPLSLVKRDTTGGAALGYVSLASNPSSTTHAARKSYVDAGDATAQSNAEATAAAALAPVKALTDAATANATANALMRRDSSGRVSVGTPEIAAHAAPKGYVDAETGAARFAGHLDGIDLNEVLDPGLYGLNAQANATTALNYPAAGIGGTLLVMRWAGTSGDSRAVTQLYQGRGSTDRNIIWIRSKIAAALGWSEWVQLANTDLATASAAGLMPAADKALLDAATSSSTGNALARRDSSGRVSVGTPTVTSHAARKDYVDAGDASAQSAAEATAAAALSPVKALTDAATANATANTLVRRDSAGRFKSATPSATTDVANKSYVDGEATTAQSNAEATAAAALAPVKTTVDNATDAATAGRLVLRDSAGRFKAAAPSADTDVANRLYVDTKDQALSSLFGELDDRTFDMQATLDAVAYRSGLRATNFSEVRGGSGWVSLQRVGWLVEVNMRLVDPIMSNGKLSGITPIPLGFRPGGRLAYNNRAALTFRVTGSGDFYSAALNTPNDTYATLTYITADPVPESFTWGGAV